MSTLLNSESILGGTMASVVTPSSYLTLHYRLSTKENAEIISTFDENPATLQLGTGQFASALEQELVGLAEGAHHVVELPPEQAYGLRNPALVQHVSRKTLQENSASTENYKVGDLVEFSAPAGGQFAGVLLSIDADAGLFDFNHPLAGQTLIFEARIIGIL
ncbi:MAG: peptidylprolyl isomerase [Solimicrobium sp.]|jgi:FKBP-type peptidyl-prolyl cis-trans isomerase SlpA|nr:peptidylprolyl isomerase [Solimicrobium sp.]